MTYTIHSDYYPDNSVTVNGPMVIAYGVAESIAKTQRINVFIKDAEGNTVHSIIHSQK